MRTPSAEDVDTAALSRERERHALVWRLAHGEIESLHGQIAGSNSMIAFAGPDGLLLDAMIDGSFQRPAADRAIALGVSWSEQLRGTNALGLALALGRPAIVHGAEHFFRGHAALTCVAAPVIAPDGSFAGVLDASSLCATRQFHTRALLGMAATHIESGLFRERFGDAVTIAFHSRAEYLRTAGAGLLALSAYGCILGLSPQAAAMLHGLPLRTGCAFGAVFADRFAVIMARSPGEHFLLRDRSGSGFTAEFLTRPAPRPRAAPPRATPLIRSRPWVAEDPAILRCLGLATKAARRADADLRRDRHRQGGTGARGACGERTQGPVRCSQLRSSSGRAVRPCRGSVYRVEARGAHGLAAEADGGTLFLDEVGDVEMRGQAALVRLLEDWMVQPVGGTAEKRVDVLLMAATNVNLPEAVAARRFRRDLLHRLSVVLLDLPRLAERSDLPAIARFLLDGIDHELRLTADAIGLLARQPWPGNIRELRNLLLRASLESGPVIDAGALKPLLPVHDSGDLAACDLGLDVARMIARTRSSHGGSVSETARRLGVSRNRVYRAVCRLEGDETRRR